MTELRIAAKPKEPSLIRAFSVACALLAAPIATLAANITLACKWKDGDPKGMQIFDIDTERSVVRSRNMGDGPEYTVRGVITDADITFPIADSDFRIRIDRNTGEQLYYDQATGGWGWRNPGRRCERLKAEDKVF